MFDPLDALSRSHRTSPGQAAQTHTPRRADSGQDLRVRAGRSQGLATAPAVSTFQDLMMYFPGELTLSGTARAPTEREFALAKVTPQEVADALVGRNPIGTTLEQWEAVLTELGMAIRSENMGDVQIGITGTSVRFLSENGVLFPTTAQEVWEQV